MTFRETLNAAIADILANGFDSEDRVTRWLQEIAAAARRSLIPESQMRSKVSSELNRVFDREIRAIARNTHFASRFTIEQVKPRLRGLLDRKILASAQLIKLNRDTAIDQTIQRMAGWMTSVPAGGTDIESRAQVAKVVRRGIGGLSYRERFVVIDQGHKLAASINEVVCIDGGAIAGKWKHIKRGPPSYDARPEHVVRNDEVLLIRDSWAHKEGLVKPGKAGYTDDVEQPAQLPYCSCRYEYKFSLRDLPDDMLTVRGKEALLEARAKLRNVA